MKTYSTKVKPFSGTDYHELISKALLLYKKIKKYTKRKPYIRSAYFKKDKIFIDYFWSHLKQKS